MYEFVTERELLLVFGMVAILATVIITEWELKKEDKELEELQSHILRNREFHSETFEEMDKDKIYKW